MSKVIVIGTDPALRDLIGDASRRSHFAGGHVEVEYLTTTDIARFARKRPQAVVMDVRVSSPIAIEVISRLKARAQPPALMLQVTSLQKQDAAWTQLLPAARTVLFTSGTSKSEARELLQSLLSAPVRPTEPTALPLAPPPKSPKADWREQNDRRIDLIFRELETPLTGSEQAELAQLQQEADAHVNRTRTLDFDALNDFNAQARKLLEHG